MVIEPETPRLPSMLWIDGQLRVLVRPTGSVWCVDAQDVAMQTVLRGKVQHGASRLGVMLEVVGALGLDGRAMRCEGRAPLHWALGDLTSDGFLNGTAYAVWVGMHGPCWTLNASHLPLPPPLPGSIPCSSLLDGRTMAEHAVFLVTSTSEAETWQPFGTWDDWAKAYPERLLVHAFTTKRGHVMHSTMVYVDRAGA